MNNEKQSHDYVLTVYVFFASTNFTALFFLLQTKNTIQNYEFFVTGVAIASMLFILLVMGRLNISRGHIKESETFGQLIGWLGVGGIAWMMFILIALLWEIDFVIGVIVAVFSYTIFAILEVQARRSRSNP